jgi:SulP family sulfate permease
MGTTESASTGRSIVPLLKWRHAYRRSFLRPDILAGVTVAALIVPKNLGYAEIAGVPIENGLYAAATGAILYAIFGTSRQISTGPSSGLSAVAGSAVVAAGLSSVTEAASLVAAIALVAGLLFIAMSLLHLGWISQFISKAVITGFLFGAAIDVVSGELSKITGSESSGDNAWQEVWSWIEGLGELHQTTLLVGAVSLAALFGMRSALPQLPAELIVVVVGLVSSRWFDLHERGVAIVGDVPRGLPSLVGPDADLLFDHVTLIAGAALAIVMIGFSQSAGDARYFASKNGYRIDINQESLAQGVANAGAGLLQGIPVSTSLSASSLNDRAGAKTPVASLVTGGAVLLTLVFFAPWFSDLPKAVLGAVVIEAVTLGMMDVPEMRRIYRVKRSDFWIAVAALIGVVLFGILAGVLVGVVLSLLWLVRVVTSPSIPLLGRARGTHVFRSLDDFPTDEQVQGVLALRPEGALFFATADSLEERIHNLVELQVGSIKLVVLDCQSVNFIDAQGAEVLGRIAGYLSARNVDFRLARVKSNVSEVLDRSWKATMPGSPTIYLDVNSAVEGPLRQ